jgi:pyridoxine/pyridoxamine 5'-phosphate oxidase
MAEIARAQILDFLKTKKFGVVASISPEGKPQSAVVGIAVTDDLEILFDTLTTTRKIRNLRRARSVSMVVGWDRDEITVQIDGIADEPHGAELARLKETYFASHPGGREREGWPNITWVRIRPQWLRYSDFSFGGTVVEFTRDQL